MQTSNTLRNAIEAFIAQTTPSGGEFAGHLLGITKQSNLITITEVGTPRQVKVIDLRGAWIPVEYSGLDTNMQPLCGADVRTGLRYSVRQAYPIQRRIAQTAEVWGGEILNWLSNPPIPAAAAIKVDPPVLKVVAGKKTAQPEAIAAKLDQLANAMQGDIDRKRAPREENTHRKARMAASAREDAEEMELVQVGLRALAAGWRAGSVPTVLQGINNRAIVEDLILRFYGERNPRYRRTFDEYGSNATQYLNRFHGDDARMAKVGITDVKAAYDALYVLIDSEGGIAERDPKAEEIEKLIREVRFSKIEGFFPTPKDVVDQMIDRAQLRPGLRVLEPSGGTGNIADEARNCGCPTDVIEIVPSLARILELKGHCIVARDFTTFTPAEPYDRVLMNPPFERGQDMDHVQRAYQFTRPGGKVVAIMGVGAFFRSDKKATAFREWLDGLEHDVEPLPEGAFKESGTSVATRLVVIERAA